MHALDPIRVTPEKLARWLDVSRGFGPAGELLVIQLSGFAVDPVRHRARRAADTAREMMTGLQGADKVVAEALAAELESRATS